MTINSKLTRRKFITASATAGGGLVLGFYIPDVFSNDIDTASQPWETYTDKAGAEVNAWLVISADDTVTIRVAQSEMGEGVFTSMPMIIAEELHCDWSKVRAEYASANRSLREGGVYKRMTTAGSSAVRRSRIYLQQAGASARERLIQAAADQWGVSASSCIAKNSVVTHEATGQSLRYGEVAAAAAKVKLSEEPKIKTPDKFTLLGQPVARLDTQVKVDGSAKFGIDVRLPDMLYATTKSSPVVGARVKSYDFDAIKDRPGVHSVVEFKGENNPVGLRSGVAVVADTWWRAKTALDLLPIEWDYGPNTHVNSKDIAQQDIQVLNEKSGITQYEQGDAPQAISTASKAVEAIYSAPYQAHATMEPSGCTAQVKSDRVDVWLGTQDPEGALRTSAKLTGVAPENVHVHNCFLGGGFGTRGSRSEVIQAIEVAKTLSGRPVNLVWTREEDFNNDYFNPNARLKFQAALDSDGMPTAWFNHITVDSFFEWLVPKMRKNGLDWGATNGLLGPDSKNQLGERGGMAYQIPNMRVEYTMRNTHIPVGFWRAPGHNHNIFMRESFIDELAHTSGKDPVDYRRALLKQAPDWLNVLEKVVDKANWGKTLPRGTAQGFAITEGFGTIAAQVAQVTVSKNGEIKIDKIVNALDCGHVINPLTIEMQMESALVYGLSAALYGEITLENGRVQQDNYDDYPVMRINDMPEVETHFALSGGKKWGGIGEAGLPVGLAAVANAIFSATGKRIRSIPFKHYDLSWS